VAIVPALQIRLMDVAAEAQTLAAALNHSAFNIANALGAWLGGVAIAGGLGWASTGWVGALLAVAGLLIFAWSVKDERRNSPSGALIVPTARAAREWRRSDATSRRSEQQINDSGH
jgi:DHA1 family inner membrane transport protein